MRKDSRHSNSLPPIILNLVIAVAMEIAPSPCENSRRDICSDRNLSGENAVLLNEYSSKLQVFLNRLDDSVSIFGDSFCAFKEQNVVGQVDFFEAGIRTLKARIV